MLTAVRISNRIYLSSICNDWFTILSMSVRCSKVRDFSRSACSKLEASRWR